jgi:hypothetical protein
VDGADATVHRCARARVPDHPDWPGCTVALPMITPHPARAALRPSPRTGLTGTTRL